MENKRRKVAQGSPEVTGTWGKGPAPSGAAERHAYNVLNDATCIQYCRGEAENTVHDREPFSLSRFYIYTYSTSFI